MQAVAAAYRLQQPLNVSTSEAALTAVAETRRLLEQAIDTRRVNRLLMRLLQSKKPRAYSGRLEGGL
jgi:hypothetical protein